MSIDPEHEKAYSPSAWSRRFSSEEIITHFVQLAQEVTQKVRSTISCELDVPYGVEKTEKYDIYGNNLPNDAPIFVFIHGGYWQQLSKDLAAFPVEVLVSRGIKVFVVGYSLCPAVSVSEIVAQTKVATAKILKHARDIGSKRVWIAGHSVGAHLTASIIHDDEWLTSMNQQKCSHLIKGLILIAGIYNLKPLLGTSYNEALKLSSDEVNNLSFGSLDTSQNKPINDIKVIVAVGECDAPIFVKESKNYAQKLVGFVDNVEFLLIRNNIDHFDIIENLTDSNFALTKIIIDHVNA